MRRLLTRWSMSPGRTSARRAGGTRSRARVTTASWMGWPLTVAGTALGGGVFEAGWGGGGVEAGWARLVEPGVDGVVLVWGVCAKALRPVSVRPSKAARTIGIPRIGFLLRTIVSRGRGVGGPAFVRAGHITKRRGRNKGV